MVRADYYMGPVEASDIFYYGHLEGESPLRIGTGVSAGQVVGYAGDTGDTGQGPSGPSGLFPPHLHPDWYNGSGGRETVATTDPVRTGDRPKPVASPTHPWGRVCNPLRKPFRLEKTPQGLFTTRSRAEKRRH
jgi:murein DD-endopeptidase MepM/ murein hydrolase activator NlpD